MNYNHNLTQSISKITEIRWMQFWSKKYETQN